MPRAAGGWAKSSGTCVCCSDWRVWLKGRCASREGAVAAADSERDGNIMGTSVHWRCACEELTGGCCQMLLLEVRRIGARRGRCHHCCCCAMERLQACPTSSSQLRRAAAAAATEPQ